MAATVGETGAGASGKTARRDPEASRQALIDATLDMIAEVGITDTTVSSIIERAGLSRGMIHLHFRGKDNLLTESARCFSDAYYAEMDRQVAEAGEAPEDVVMAVIRADLGEALLNPRSTRIWHAFRGVAHSHPGIARYSSTQDARLRETLFGAFGRIARADGGADDLTVRQATYGTLAMLEGMWVHYLADMESFSRDEAALLIRRFLSGLFPGRFRPTANGTAGA